jgi:hypothetical protein
LFFSVDIVGALPTGEELNAWLLEKALTCILAGMYGRLEVVKLGEWTIRSFGLIGGDYLKGTLVILLVVLLLPGNPPILGKFSAEGFS